MTRENITGRAQFRFAAMAAAILGSATPAGAQESAARWNVDWGAQYCSLFRSGGADDPTTVGYRIIPGLEKGEAVFIARTGSLDDLETRDTVAIVLSPDGDRYESLVRAGSEDGHRIVIAEDVPDDFLDRLEEASEIRLEHETSTSLTMPLPGARQAVAALRTCIDQVLVEWGVDPKVSASLRQPPDRDESSRTFSYEDYPSQAVIEKLSGSVVVRLSIDEQGRATDCVPVASSGHEILDDATCRLFKSRSRYTPAIGADGKPTQAFVISYVRWILP